MMRYPQGRVPLKERRRAGVQGSDTRPWRRGARNDESYRFGDVLGVCFRSQFPLPDGLEVLPCRVNEGKA